MSPEAAPPAHPSPADKEKDASLKEILFYALGSVEGTLSNPFFNLINTLMIVALGMNPVFLGLILGIKTLWDGIADPLMAHVTDNARTRWGRRRPFILFGGVTRVLLLVAIFGFFPRDPSIKTNAALASEQTAAHATAKATDHTPSPVQASPAAAIANAPIPTPEAKTGMIDKIKLGIAEFKAAGNAYHREVIIYLLAACLLFTTLGTFFNVPYYALGIELCPSYDGRTRVVTYRSIVNKLGGFVSPWILPFCFLTIFTTVVDGLFWYGVICASVGVPATVLMVRYSKERLYLPPSGKKNAPGLLRSIWLTAKNVHFLKILLLYKIIGYSNGIFAQIGLFLSIYWVYSGDALAGATLGGYTGTLAALLTLISLPVINWACRRLQKHRALRYGIIWMSIGSALNWVLINPAHPYWQLVLPFFFSIGISSVFTILPTMMADVTDIDELRTGARREGMFGAVMGFLMKLTGTLEPVLAGVVLLIAGFDSTLGAHQAPETILRMRLMFSLIPAGLMLLGLIVLWRYPLTREYMAEVKEQLLSRRAAQAVADK
ncbi:MAG: MFS transporter [Opitutaceae bacterium]|jgi:GPH family glycoside/pentoside/hexuronide:cation symporter